MEAEWGSRSRKTGRRRRAAATKSDRYDVAIVGGGPAGLTRQHLARALSASRRAHRLRRSAQLGDARRQRLPRPSRTSALRSFAAWDATRRAGTASSSWTATCERVTQTRRGALRAHPRRRHGDRGTAAAARHRIEGRVARRAGARASVRQHRARLPRLRRPRLQRQEGRRHRLGPESGRHGAQPHDVDAATSSSARTASRRTSTCASTARSSTRSNIPVIEYPIKLRRPQRLARALHSASRAGSRSTATRSSSPSGSIRPTTSARSSAASATRRPHHRRRSVPHLGAQLSSRRATSCPVPSSRSPRRRMARSPRWRSTSRSCPPSGSWRSSSTRPTDDSLTASSAGARITLPTQRHLAASACSRTVSSTTERSPFSAALADQLAQLGDAAHRLKLGLHDHVAVAQPRLGCR